MILPDKSQFETRSVRRIRLEELLRRARAGRRFPLAAEPGTAWTEPLIVLSAGRSGTTLLRTMLASGGDLALPPETQALHRATREFLATEYRGWRAAARAVVAVFAARPNTAVWGADFASIFRRAARLSGANRCLACVIAEVYRGYAEAQAPEAINWGDKSPIHTFRLDAIFPAFPRARYLHVVRDGRDVVSSMVRRHGADYLDTALSRWQASLRRIEEFRATADPIFLEVRYEDLVTEPKATLAMVCQFAGVPYRDRMLQHWHAPTTVEHRLKSAQRNVGKPVFTSSVGAWRRRLSDSQARRVQSALADDLRRWGYA